jgi:oligoendopeptidase F
MKKAIVLIVALLAAEGWSMGYKPKHIAADSAWLVEIQQRMEKVDTMFAAARWEYYTNGEYTGDLDRARKEYNLIIYHKYNIGRMDRIQNLFENPVLNRAARLAYIRYLTLWSNKGTDIWRIYWPLKDIFINYRAEFEGKTRTNRYLTKIYNSDPDRERRKKAWFARKSIGKEIAPGLTELVKERNRLARRKDYDHFYEFKINVMGLTTDRVLDLLDMLNLATRDAYLNIYMDRKDRLNVDKLEQWDHYYDPDWPGMGSSYSKEELLPALSKTFDNMGFQTDKLGISFDLEPRERKLQNGLCVPVSVPSDIRIIASIGSGRGSYSTVFHEYGHALHFTHIVQDHYMLRDRTDRIICESMATFCENIISQP